MTTARLLAALSLWLAGPAFGWTTLPARTNDVPGFVYRPSAADWRDITIYHVMTDRFSNGNPANDTANPRGTVNYTDPDKLHGGDFAGVQQKLDYLQTLGVKAILLAPVLHNTWGAYQGYGTGDFNQIDPHWGSLADLRALIDAAHARDIYVFFDMVVNHNSDLIDSTDAGFPAYRAAPEYTPRWKPDVGTVRHEAPFDTFDKYYMHGEISNWNDDVQVVLGDYPGLDSLRTTNAQVRADFITIYKALIAATDCDGFRADTARHVEMGFWDAFLPAIANATGKTNFLVFCEATKGSEPELGPYTQSNRFNSAINFPFNGTINAVFVDRGDTGRLTHHTLPAQLTNYSARARYQLVNFLDSHDEIRYLNQLSNDVARLKVALTYLHTTIHIPYVYYGTEQGFNGGDDPYNREDMFAGGFESGPSVGDNFNYTHPLFLHLRQLDLLRATLTPLRRGGYVERWSTYQSTSGPGLYAFSRANDTDEVLIVFNTAGTAKSQSGIPVGFAAGALLVNMLDTTDTITVAAGQVVSVNLNMQTSKLYYPSALAPAIPPSVTSVSPAFTTNNVATTTTISLTFDKPMNKTATQTAFSVSPTVPGAFAWANGDTQVTFTPGQPLGANTRYTLTLAATAAGTNGQALGAAFVSYFDTGGYSSMSVAGTFNGWNPGANNMTLVGSHLWQFDTTLTNDTGVQFKFAANGAWTINWGETNQTQQTLPITGTGDFLASTNILVAGTLNGPYRFQFNDQTFAYALAVLAPPVVLGVSPGNAAYNVATNAIVSVTFDKVMDRTSTQSAFSLSPFVSGTFAWFDGDTRFEFTPTAFAKHTHYIVSVATGALGTNGQQLSAPFSSAFDTGSGYATMSVAGTFNGFSPGVNNMRIVGQNLWQWDTNFVNVASGAQFKFAANGNWGGTGSGVDWGDNNQSQFTVPMAGTGENFGANIVVSSTLNGAYRFQINDQTGAYSLQAGPADSDGDRLPDSWEQLYPTAGNPAADTDGDGFSNLQEFNAGTSPVNATDALRIVSIATSGANVLVTFTTVTGKNYAVEFRGNAGSGPWTQVGNAVAGTGAPVQVTHTNAASQSQRFYRVRLLP